MESSISYPKARKEHQCDWCSQTIQIGEVYDRQALFYDGTASTWKNHRRCSELASKLNMFRETSGEGLSQSDFCDNITEYYMEITNFDRKNKLPPFKERIEIVFKEFL